MRSRRSDSLIRGITFAAAVTVLVALGVPVAVGQTQDRWTTIDTFSAWDGISNAQPFGCNGGATTYGQVFTVPPKRHFMKSLTVKWTDLTSGYMQIDPSVYAWDGSKATGPQLAGGLFGRYTDHQPGVFYPVSLRLHAHVQPGAQYVAFASIDPYFELCYSSHPQAGWALDLSDAYSGGEFVYQNNDGDESQWTTAPWSSYEDGRDLAFTAYFRK